MTRSFAFAASAVSFRVFHTVGYMAGVSVETNYVACLWLSLFANAAAAEWVIRRRQAISFPNPQPQPVS
jgi:hypothetical protein